MIRDLDATLVALLKAGAAAGSLLARTDIVFDLPDAAWRRTINRLTLNCYLYEIHENRELRTNEPILRRSTDGKKAARVRPPIRIDCSYCITAWSAATKDAVLEEHQLLSEVLLVLLRNETIPKAVLQGTLVGQIPPFPTVIAHSGGTKNLPEFWSALDQKLKPSLNYVVTLALLLQPLDAGQGPTVTTVNVETDDKSVVDKP